MELTTLKDIELAKLTWQQASEVFGFVFLSPYSIKLNNKEYSFFGFLPEYGSKKGAIIFLVNSINDKFDVDLSNLLLENGYFYSYIPISNFALFEYQYFFDLLEDWRI